MKYTPDQFKHGEAWVAFRVDCLIQKQAVDIYVLMDASSGYAFGHVIVEGELPGSREIGELMKSAFAAQRNRPKRILFPKKDPAREIFQKHAKKNGVSLELVPLSYLELLIGPFKKSFGEHFPSPAAFAGAVDKDMPQTAERKAAQASIPDSYDPCSCGSGKKYKFCCKPIFREMIEAMSAAEEGRSDEALKWMEAAKSKVGETAEILCRYAVVYFFFDKEKSQEYLDRCLKEAPHHPRANYIKGINLKARGNLKGAVEAYKTALEHYPPSDRYHLNETLNNLGSAYYDMEDYAEAKSVWEKALVYLPEDQMVRENLYHFIYNNPSVPEEIRKISPFIERYWNKE